MMLIAGCVFFPVVVESLTSIERAWPSSPSARASVVTVAADGHASPAFVTRCTETSFTKSEVCRPPRTRATPAVGSV